jgi:hypothetical protein
MSVHPKERHRIGGIGWHLRDWSGDASLGHCHLGCTGNGGDRRRRGAVRNSCLTEPNRRQSICGRRE